jgi:tetratricopeptide (TPR) repeat protein
VRRDQGRWDDASECYEKSLKLFGDRQDNAGMAQAKLNLGNALLNQGRLDEAMVNVQQSLSVFNENGNLIVRH